MAEDLFSFLPEELLIEILIKLPVKSLLRCTSVCKSWYSRITSPRFIDTHLSLANNAEKKVILYGRHPYKYYIHRDNEAFDKIIDMDPPIVKYFGISNVGYCNGLICMYVSQIEPYNTGRVYLWNPTIRRLLQVPKPPVERYGKYWGNLGLGFVSETNDYKIIKINSGKAGVYELSTGSWKNIHNSEIFFTKYDIHCSASSCFLNGKIHWVGRGVHDNLSVIVTFDIKKEEFGVMMMPYSIHDETLYIYPMLFQGFLALEQNIRGEDGIDAVCVWVMKEYGVLNSWTIDFMIGIPHMSILMFRNNGEALFTTFRHIHTYDLVSYDPKSQKIKAVVTNSSSDLVYGEYFVPSLVLLDNRAAVI